MKKPLRVDGIEALESRIAPAKIGGVSFEFLGPDTGIAITGAEPGDEAGRVVSGVGDLNGDGIDDFALAAPFASANGYASGGVFVTFGSADGPPKVALTDIDGTNGFRVDGPGERNFLGASVSGAGDVNGDGIDDLLIGAPRNDGYGTQPGAAYVIFGTAAGFPVRIDVSALDGGNGFALLGADNGDQAGFSVSGPGDVNGDGLADLLIGAPTAGESVAGAAYLVFGKSTGFLPAVALGSLSAAEGMRIDGPTDYGGFGVSVSGVGDVNGDGMADFAIAGTGAYVVFGRDGGFASPVDVSVLDGSDGFMVSNLAHGSPSVSGAGDMNGDGLDEVLLYVKDPNASSATVIFGKADGFSAKIAAGAVNGENGFQLFASYSQTPDWRPILGASAGGAGDLNGDGLADLAFGASFRINKFRSEGAFVYLGHSGDYAPSVDLRDLDDPNILRIAGVEGQSGTSVAAAGDVNGDGADDLLIGAPGTHGFNPDVDSGAFVFFGMPALSIGSASILEGDSGKQFMEFPVTISAGGLDHAIDVSFSIKSGTATHGVDFRGATSGTLHFGPGTTQKIIRVPVLGDVEFEPDEMFTVKIRTLADIVVAGRKASGTILNDDAGDGVAVFDLDATEGFDVIVSNEGETLNTVARDAGDVNGDGFDDFIVSVTSDQPVGASLPTAYYVVFGAESGLPSPFDVATINGANGFKIPILRQFARGVENIAPAGDVNGDGIDDLIIGAPEKLPGENLPGSAYVIFGARDGFASAVDVTALDGSDGFRIDGTFGPDGFGRSVSSAGDVIGDGIGDLIIGAAQAGADSPMGAAYVVFGRADGFDAVTSVASLDGSDGFLISSNKTPLGPVGGGGDINGDGFDDLIIGHYPAPFAKVAAFVVFGHGSESAPRLDVSELDGANGFKLKTTVDRRAGLTVDIAGDVNGDGFDDLLVDAYTRLASDGLSVGKAYVVFGKEDGFGKKFNLATVDGRNGFALVGKSLEGAASPAGDINGDGFDDIAIFSPVSLSPLDYGGTGIVVLGKADGFAASAKLKKLTKDETVRFDAYPQTTPGFLLGIRGAGDVNGDGIADLIVPSTAGTKVIFGTA